MKLIITLFIWLGFALISFAQVGIFKQSIDNKPLETNKAKDKTEAFSILDICQDCCQKDDCGGGGGTPRPNPPVITANRNYVCSAQNDKNSNALNVTLTATGCAAGGMTWFIAGTSTTVALNALSITIIPNAITSYNASCSTAGGRSFRSNTVNITHEITPSTLPIVTRENTVIYVFDTIKLNASACQSNISYLWKDPTNFNFEASGPNFNFILTNHFSGKAYITFCKGNYCLGNSTTTHTFSYPVYISKNTPSVCAPVNSNVAIPVILTLHGCNKNIFWKKDNTSNSPIIGTDSILTVSPTLSTSYFATCYSANSPNGILVSTFVPVTEAPSITKTLVTLPLGGGTVFRLTASCPNSTSFLWDNGSTNAISNVSSTLAGTYSVQCGSSCLSTKKTIKIFDPPIISSSKPFVCKGQILVLSGSGCEGDIVWLGASNLNLTYLNAGINNPQTINIPNSAGLTQVYFKANCIVKNQVVSTSAVISIPVNTGTIPANPVVSSVPDPANITLGDTIRLTASGCQAGRTFWNTLDTALIIKKAPIETTDYYAYCRTNSCPSNGVLKTVNVIDLAPPTISVSESTVCFGQQGFTLSGQNCPGGVITFYERALVASVNTVITTGSSTFISPSETKYYTATCIFSGIVSGFELPILVNVVGPATIASENNITHIFSGQTLRLTANCGADTVVWNTGLISPIILVSPSVSTIYTAYCKDAPCQSLGTDFTVNVCPVALNYISPINDFTINQVLPTSKIIVASNKITGIDTHVNYKSTESISLFPGFKAETGTIFKAEIAGCN
jgi:large repetitive protein